MEVIQVCLVEVESLLRNADEPTPSPEDDIKKINAAIGELNATLLTNEHMTHSIIHGQQWDMNEAMAITCSNQIKSWLEFQYNS